MAHSPEHAIQETANGLMSGNAVYAWIVLFLFFVIIVLGALKKGDENLEWAKKKMRKFIGLSDKKKPEIDESSVSLAIATMQESLEAMSNENHRLFESLEYRTKELIENHNTTISQKVDMTQDAIKNEISIRFDSVNYGMNQQVTWIKEVERKADEATNRVAIVEGRLATGNGQ